MATTAPLDVPPHLAGTRPALDPYGQLLRMLMPRALFVRVKGVWYYVEGAVKTEAP